MVSPASEADVIRQCATFLRRRASGIRATASREPRLHEHIALHAAIAAQALDDAAESLTLQAVLRPARAEDIEAAHREAVNEQVKSARSALSAAGWIGRADMRARQERPDAPRYDDRTVQGILMAAESLRCGEPPP